MFCENRLFLYNFPILVTSKKYTMKFFLFMVCALIPFCGWTQETTPSFAENDQENNVKVIEFGKKLLNSFHESDADFFYENFNKEAFISEVITSTESTPKEKSQLFEDTFEKGFLQSYFKIPENIHKLINEGASYDIVNYYYHLDEKKYHLLFRLFTADDTLDYHDFQLAYVDGDFLVQNMYPYKAGEYVSETLQQIHTIVNTKLSGDSEKNKERQQVYFFLVRYGTAFADDHERAFTAINNLQGDFTDSKLYHVLKIKIASNINDVFYVEAVDELLKKFPYDTSTSLYALDYYVLLKNYNASMQILDDLAEITEDDFLEYIRANVAVEFDDHQTAEKGYSYIVSQYPRFNGGFINLMFLYDQLEKHEDNIVLLQRIIDNTEYTKTDLVNFIDDDENGLEYLPNARIYKRWKRKK